MMQNNITTNVVILKVDKRKRTENIDSIRTVRRRFEIINIAAIVLRMADQQTFLPRRRCR